MTDLKSVVLPIKLYSSLYNIYISYNIDINVKEYWKSRIFKKVSIISIYYINNIVNPISNIIINIFEIDIVIYGYINNINIVNIINIKVYNKYKA